jgi:hypothetical protein
MSNLNLQIETFIALFGDEGVQFIRVEDEANAELLYEGGTLTRTKKVKGYGVPLDATFYSVCSDSEEARNQYEQIHGPVTSGSLIMGLSGGIREREELY